MELMVNNVVIFRSRSTPIVIAIALLQRNNAEANLESPSDSMKQLADVYVLIHSLEGNAYPAIRIGMNKIVVVYVRFLHGHSVLRDMCLTMKTVVLVFQLV